MFRTIEIVYIVYYKKLAPALKKRVFLFIINMNVPIQEDTWDIKKYKLNNVHDILILTPALSLQKNCLIYLKI